MSGKETQPDPEKGEPAAAQQAIIGHGNDTSISHLEIAHQMNLQQAKLALYTDYYLNDLIRDSNEQLSTDGEEILSPIGLSENVSRYCKSPWM